MTSPETAKAEVRALLEKYNKLAAEQKLDRYNEEMTKKDFILPLFRALGWDVENSGEVTAEETIGKTRVDYGFRINGIPKFFLEAKALKEDLDNPQFIEQAINYSWHKGCTWAVLADFESVKIYNAEWKTASPMQSHLKTVPCYEFLDRFQELWLLSKESFEQGLLDKEAEKWGKKTKKSPVDRQLLSDFTRFRELLSKNITSLNQGKNVTEEDLDEAVQRLLDRLIFIRNCEDRELEAKTLLPNLREWESRGKGQMIKSLREVFAHFDKEYNSKIFASHLCDDLDLDNEVLHEIIEGLYYTRDKSISYDFSAIEADVLGNIYEQYLGHILKKTEKRAKLSEAHAHRKEQGIYYTPTYIVDYIVRNTLDEVLRRKAPKEIEKLRILDPACGSGSFLIKAFDVLNEHYAKNDKDYGQTRLDSTGLGATYTRKLRILKDNIFGVDLDKQAVEIAQLNLLLKIAERKHRLPLLQENIKCGNSLIDDEKIAGDRAFAWERQFPEIMKGGGSAPDGGFDVIIGNPPYVQLSMEATLPESVKQYLLGRFESSMGRLNTFGFFIKLGIDIMREGGRLGFIVPNTVLTQDYYEELRGMILQNCKIESIVGFADLPFKDAVVENVILVLEKTKSQKKRETNQVKVFSVNAKLEFVKQKVINQSVFNQTRKRSFIVFIDEKAESIRNKIEKNTKPLKEFFEINQAIALKHDRAKYLSKEQINKTYHPVIDGRHVNRYSLKWDGNYLRYDVNAIHSCKREDIFVSPEKIFFRRVSATLIATIDTEKFYALNTLVVMNKKEGIPNNIRYFLGLFNSQLMNYYYTKFLKSTKQVFSEIQARQIKELPIKLSDKKEECAIVELVDKMLTLNKRLTAIGDKKTDERAKIEEEIRKTDTEIDEVVYKLYGVTEAEKKVVEEKLT